MMPHQQRFIACFEAVLDFAQAMLGRLPTTAELVELHTDLLELERHYRWKSVSRVSA